MRVLNKIVRDCCSVYFLVLVLIVLVKNYKEVVEIYIKIYVLWFVVFVVFVCIINSKSVEFFMVCFEKRKQFNDYIFDDEKRIKVFLECYFNYLYMKGFVVLLKLFFFKSFLKVIDFI